MYSEGRAKAPARRCMALMWFLIDSSMMYLVYEEFGNAISSDVEGGG